MGERILEGSLRAVSVPDLLTFINMMKKTGTLTMDLGEAVKRIYWSRGEMVFASSTLPEESLGNFLVRHGQITQEQNMKAGLQVEPGRRQGKVLIQMGILSPKQLWWAVKNQVLEIVYSLFSIRDGAFSFEETPEPNEEKIKLSTSTTNIIMEGIRRLDEWPRIKEFIPDDRRIPHPAPPENRDKSVKFYPGEQEVLGLVDGRRTIREIIHASPMDEFETLRVITSLILAGYVQIEGRESVPREDEADDTSALMQLIETYNALFKKIRTELQLRLSADQTAGLFLESLKSSRGPVLEGVSCGASGELDRKVLLSNVADFPHERRYKALHGALDNLLSFLLFEASKYLDSNQKNTIYRLVEDKSSTET
ncbi:MAG: DUF4388 domain-containing protein [Acidobacteriota bacterium]|jgi:hypothetical protein